MKKNSYLGTIESHKHSLAGVGNLIVTVFWKRKLKAENSGTVTLRNQLNESVDTRPILQKMTFYLEPNAL